MAKKVFVSGCFDLLHSGHVEFFKEAASYGDLYVALGSDRTITELKGRPPVNTEAERLFMVQSVAWVKEAFISQGSGLLDFAEELKAIKPDIFIVNEDGNTPAKRELCEALGIEYRVLRREPHPGLTPRSTTALRSMCRIPYRIDIAGGWLDQPFVSKHYPGAVITISLEPTVEFNERSGMASSTRRAAIELWGPRLPVDNYEKLAKILFCYDNPPGTQEISGSQDAIGIVFPGLNKSYYEGEYWPSRIESVQDEATLRFIENALYLVPLGPRESGFSVLSDTHITREGARALSEATDNCWDAILNHDIRAFGKYFRASLEAQVAMFPNMMTPMVARLIDQYRDVALGWKLSGAGGGGYLILVADHPIEAGFQITIRRADY
ncbi:MAG TPA: adenylyltransferase/cytidyltransferase family protein [Anaerolineae bacterium]|nr:adenylyltransferase/cytidyltransferase family protein [Anaerolineae bacterium]HQK14416.1 adenylyltransferase/cytidyltransferase family protein [Anaerolineae bacterium]